jgi:hypothetical protein
VKRTCFHVFLVEKSLKSERVKGLLVPETRRPGKLDAVGRRVIKRRCIDVSVPYTNPNSARRTPAERRAGTAKRTSHDRRSGRDSPGFEKDLPGRF